MHIFDDTIVYIKIKNKKRNTKSTCNRYDKRIVILLYKKFI